MPRAPPRARRPRPPRRRPPRQRRRRAQRRPLPPPASAPAPSRTRAARSLVRESNRRARRTPSRASTSAASGARRPRPPTNRVKSFFSTDIYCSPSPACVSRKCDGKVDRRGRRIRALYGNHVLKGGEKGGGPHLTWRQNPHAEHCPGALSRPQGVLGCKFLWHGGKCIADAQDKRERMEDAWISQYHRKRPPGWSYPLPLAHIKKKGIPPSIRAQRVFVGVNFRLFDTPL
jgi:hypothetical protein